MTPETTKRLERFCLKSNVHARVERYRSVWWSVIGTPRTEYISKKGRTLEAAMRRFLKKAGY